MTSTQIPAEPEVYGPDLEDSVVGTWFARLGVLAVLLGAAFGYRYAVDQGWIDPAARVALGAFIGVVFVVGGHVARGRRWDAFASALSGGGIAIMYLATLAALVRYELITPATGLIVLTAIATTGAMLAARYDSLSLSLLSTLGAFVNPFLVAAGDPDPTSALTYVAAVDLGIVLLAYRKRWPVLQKIALVGSAGVVVSVAGDATPLIGVAYTTILWTIFTAIPFMHVLGDRGRTSVTDAVLLVVTTTAYFGAGMYFLAEVGSFAQGMFTVGLGAACAAATGLALSDERSRRFLPDVLGGLAVAFFVASAPILTDGAVVELMWSLEGTLLLWIGSRAPDTRVRAIAGVLVAVGLLGTVDNVSTYHPGELFLSGESMVLVGQIASLFAAAVLLVRFPGRAEWDRIFGYVLAATASLLTLAWFSREAIAEVERSVDEQNRYAAVQFTVSAVWGCYAAVMFAIGVARTSMWVRYLAIGVFALTLLKMVTVDLWELEELYRMMAFGGLGLLMLVCSLLYNRFRDAIAAGDQVSSP